jgi:hypothetical protein
MEPEPSGGKIQHSEIQMILNDSYIASLNSFDPIGLDRIDSVGFMNRIETKYLFSVKKLEDLISLVHGKYKILEIDKKRAFSYLTIYMDTDDYLFYNQHVRGELERHKIRYRIYESTGLSFLEIKKKTNKGRTIKRRIVNDHLAGSFDDTAVTFIRQYLPVNYIHLKPVLISRFTRVTLIGLETKERITIDYDISFTGSDGNGQVAIPFLAIAELKKSGYSHCSPFNNLIRNLNIYPTGFSKYCFGNATINDSLKKNMVKPKLLLINKIENENVSTFSIRSDQTSRDGNN